MSQPPLSWSRNHFMHSVQQLVIKWRAHHTTAVLVMDGWDDGKDVVTGAESD